MRATLVLRLAIDEASAKIRTGPPVDDDADYALPFWAGELPMRTTLLPAISDPRLTSGIPVPAHVTRVSPSRAAQWNRLAGAMPASEHILFTGFPGFIGERLLPRLLERRPDAAFVCLVQKHFADAAARSRAEIEARHPYARGRIVIVDGDITRPDLGLGEAPAVLPSLTAAYHLAAVYDLAVSRDLGMRVNVEGTRNVLRFLARAPRLQRLHYVSTAYVSGTTTGVFRETDLDVGQRFKNFYEETKFLAEVEVARSGLPATIYRPAIVVGDSRTGETGKFDGPYFTLSAMERVPSPGLFIKVGWGRNPANLVPVDFIIDALAGLAEAAASGGKTYHLTDPAIRFR